MRYNFYATQQHPVPFTSVQLKLNRLLLQLLFMGGGCTYSTHDFERMVIARTEYDCNSYGNIGALRELLSAGWAFVLRG